MMKVVEILSQGVRIERIELMSSHKVLFAQLPSDNPRACHASDSLLDEDVRLLLRAHCFEPFCEMNRLQGLFLSLKTGSSDNAHHLRLRFDDESRRDTISRSMC